MFDIIVLLCHLVTVVPGQDIKTCHEVRVFRAQPMQACMMAQFGIAQWKENSRYAGDEYSVEGWKCASPGYVLKDDRA